MRLMTISEASKQSGISYTKLVRLIDLGRIKAKNLGLGSTRSLRVTEIELQRFVESCDYKPDNQPQPCKLVDNDELLQAVLKRVRAK